MEKNIKQPLWDYPADYFWSSSIVIYNGSIRFGTLLLLKLCKNRIWPCWNGNDLYATFWPSFQRFNVVLGIVLYLCSLMVWTFRNKERDITPIVVALETPIFIWILIPLGCLLTAIILTAIENESILIPKRLEYILEMDYLAPILISIIPICCLALSIRLSSIGQDPKPHSLKKRIRWMWLKVIIILSIFSLAIFPNLFHSIPKELTSTKIAFVHNDRIYSINADGSNPTQLTNMGYVDDGFPTWSPDGQQIAFQTSRQDTTWSDWSDLKYSRIDRMNADGSGRVTLTPDSSNNREPTWSPDSQQIAFVSNRDGNSEIYVMNADGSNPQRLTNNPAKDIQPDWSPDGKSIAFVSDRDGHGEIYVMNVDGSGVHRLTYSKDQYYYQPEAFYPNWSPDGQKIAFSSGDRHGDVYIINADGEDLKRIADGIHPTWAPNGRAIAYIDEQYFGDFWDPGSPVSNGLWIVNLDNSDYKIAAARDFYPASKNYQKFYNPSWGPFTSDQL